MTIDAVVALVIDMIEGHRQHWLRAAPTIANLRPLRRYRCAHGQYQQSESNK